MADTYKQDINNLSGNSRKLKVFLSYSPSDSRAVYTLYQRLEADGIQLWLDSEDLIPGQRWQEQILRALRASDVVIVCLSRSSITKAGYVHKEISFALDVAEQAPEGNLFIIPVRLEETEVPERLSAIHWVDLFDEKGYDKLLRALQLRAREISNVNLPVLQTNANSKAVVEEFLASTPRIKGPVANPYVGHSGRPVMPPNFVGREDIIREIHQLWQSKGQLPPIVLYGHRRMGKTSTLRNLNPEKNPDIILVLIDMQDAGLVDNTAQLFYEFASAIYKQANLAGLTLEAKPVISDYTTTGQARLQLNKLLETINAQMKNRRLILAVDEFEIIQKRIEEGKIEAEALDYLRAINQRYDWLGLVFAGLHELEEMGRDYKGAFYGSAKHRKVSYLQPETARRLITQPGNADFKLQYDPELVEEIYKLTYGQPYLTQLLCWQLVENWNERAEAKPEGISPRLTLTDLEEILSERFFEDADYYFLGVWQQINTTEQALLKTLAEWQEHKKNELKEIVPIEKTELCGIAELSKKDLGEILGNLERRDLLIEIDGQIGFFSEIMRQWVVRQVQNEPKTRKRFGGFFWKNKA